MRCVRKWTPEKRCTICGKRYWRKRFRGRLEDRTVYMKRRFCSLSCANSRTRGGLSRKAFHARARKLRKAYCEACRARTRLHAHHVNENWRDNHPRNVQTLCVIVLPVGQTKAVTGYRAGELCGHEYANSFNPECVVFKTEGAKIFALTQKASML